MKSAYELALEKSGGGLRQYTDAEKEALAEVDRKYDARAAQARFDAAARRRACNKPEDRDRVAEELTVELASIERRREQAKDKIRGTAGPDRTD